MTTSTLTLPDGRALEYVEGGDPAGVPTLVHHGTPGGPVLDPGWESSAREHGLRLVLAARPGYAGSTRHPGRCVADVVVDTVALADHLGVDRFLTWGWSGGGPHALACAALLPERVVAAATLAGVAPYDADGLDFLEGMGEGNIEEFGLALEGEEALRPLAQEQGAAMADVTPAELAEAMAPHLTPVDAAEITGPGTIGATLAAQTRTGFAAGVDGWVDDDLMFTRPWGCGLADVKVPVLLLQGRQDAMVPFGHGEWLARQLDGVVDARLTEEDGHLTLVTRRLPEVFAWLRARWDAAAG